jgi:hypothetical protein
LKEKDDTKIINLASLPEWIFIDSYSYHQAEINKSFISEADKLMSGNDSTAAVAALYLTHFDPDSNVLKKWLNESYPEKNKGVTLPEYAFNTKKNYAWKIFSLQELSIRCYSILYGKEFNDVTEYERFLAYCNHNYLAYYRYQKKLTIADCEINE